MENIKIDKKDMVDFSNRLGSVLSIGNSIGLNRDDMALVLFILMGDAKDGNLNEILKKAKLPRINANYDKAKLRK
ncbi:MAG: hypothetical protein OWT27_08625, partial [Firmicutes bacterium]|nr:hypothetical protein [Bacillota bacterium]